MSPEIISNNFMSGQQNVRHLKEIILRNIERYVSILYVVFLKFMKSWYLEYTEGTYLDFVLRTEYESSCNWWPSRAGVSLHPHSLKTEIETIYNTLTN
jgi:hypothetical protein